MLDTEFAGEVESAEDESARHKVELSLKEAGLEEKLDAQVMDRLILLERHSRFNEDSRLIERGVNNVLQEIARRKTEYRMSPERLSEAKIAALIHDVGKTGPLAATPEEQLAVVRLFAVENLKDPQQSVEDAVTQLFPGQAEEMKQTLQSCGIDITLSMQKFWESHARYGFEIIDNQCPQLTKRTKLIAASHHIDKGDEFNFYGVPNEDIPDESKFIGQLENYLDILQERALIAIDKYEANIRRSGANHESAMDWVENNIKKKFGNDVFMNLVIAVMREIGKEKIFGE